MSSPRGKVELPTDLLIGEVERLMEQGCTVTLTVRGNSMLPLIRNGDRAVLAPARTRDLWRGAVVLARTVEGVVVLHRIIGYRDDGGMVLQGDGNIGLTEQTTSDRMIALLTHVHHGRRTYACHSTGWCFVSWLWQALHPFRRLLLGVIRRVDRWRRKEVYIR